MNGYLKEIITFWQIRPLSSYEGICNSYAHIQLRMVLQRSLAEMQRPTRAQQGCSALCVISQQYFSAIFTSKGFHFRTQ
jgi:hypothetical protein